MIIGPKLAYQNCSKKWLLFKKSSGLISYSVSFSSGSIIRYASISATKKVSRQRRTKVKTVAEVNESLKISESAVTATIKRKRGRPRKTIEQAIEEINELKVSESMPELGAESGPEAETGASSEAKAPAYTRLLKFVSTYQKENPTHVALIRVGDFYELYFDQADIIGKLLCLTVVTKTVRGVSFRFTGVPSKALYRHLNTLVLRNNLCVAVIEQFQNPRNKIFYRKVDRIYTPGTWNGEEEDEQSRTNNYLLSIASSSSSAAKVNDFEKLDTESSDKEELAMAWVDLSTGDFWVGTTKLKDFHYELARLRPKEIVLSKKLESKTSLVNTFDSWPSIITYEPDSTYSKYKYDDSLKYLRKQLAQFSPLENRAGIGLLNYVEKTQGGRPLDLTLPLKGDSEHRMRVNLTTMRSLELFETQLSDASKLSPNSLRNTRVTAQNSLFHLLDQCQTRGGSRLLAERLIAPSTDLEEINDRLDLIEFFVQNPHLLSQIQQLFKGIKDPPRLLQRISMGQSHPRDLVDLQRCLALFNSIKEILSNFVDNKNTPKSVRALFDQIEEFDKLQDMINTTIKPPPYSLEEATSELANSHSWINPNFNDELVKLISERVVLDESRDVMEQELKAFSGLRTLKLLANNLLGKYVEINTRDKKKLTNYAEKAKLSLTAFQSLKSKSRYYFKPWTVLAIKQQENEQAISKLEQSIYQSLIDEVSLYSGRILINLRLISQLDLAATMAQLSNQHQLTRPKFVLEPTIHIKGGRHLAVERSLMDKMANFVRNDCYLTGVTASKSSFPKNTWIITGPNMGGKSTFLRQTAIISIMAQSGLFVPAESTELGIVDQVFTRIGSADHLTQHKSTFFLEMEETAHILHSATHRSLVIIDEIGRGTSSDEGLALAYAILHRLHSEIGCLTLFATHFHQLAEITNKSLPGVIPYYSTIKEDSDGFTYFHKLKLGISSTSHAVRAAQLALMPVEVIDMAEKMLKNSNNLISNNERAIDKVEYRSINNSEKVLNNNIDSKKIKELKGIIEDIDFETMSMLKVQNLIKKLKLKAKNV